MLETTALELEDRLVGRGSGGGGHAHTRAAGGVRTLTLTEWVNTGHQWQI